MIIGAINWIRTRDRSPESGGKSYLYLCYEEKTHNWWIGHWNFEGARHQGERVKEGWTGGGDPPSHWAELPTPSDSTNRFLAREEKRA